MARYFDLKIFFSIYYAVAVSTAYTPCKVCFFRASDDSLKNMSLRLYIGDTISDWKSVPITNSTDLVSEMDPNKPSVLYVSGWSETPDSKSVQLIMSGYAKRGDHNRLLLDYSHLSQKPYPFAVFSTDGIGYTVGKAISEMVACGLNSSSLHIVGHSLGVQVAGSIARHADFEVPRITGLDPAGPGFDELDMVMTTRDARFIDVIHTDVRFYGSNKTTGHLNSFPNGGCRVQAGCPEYRTPFSDEDFCDHHRSWYYFAESLIQENAFIGVKCNSYDFFKRGSCQSNERVTVGFGTPTTARGNVYFQTNSASPFGRGENGTTYSPSGFSLTSVLSSANLIPFGW